MDSKVSEHDARMMVALLKDLSDMLDHLLPNVKGASDLTKDRARAFICDARRWIDGISKRLMESEYPLPIEFTYSRSDMIDEALKYAKLLEESVGEPSRMSWEDYTRNLGLLVDFISRKFPR